MKPSPTLAPKPFAACSHMPWYPEVTYTPGTGILKLIHISLSMQGSLCLVLALLCKAKHESELPMRITLWGGDTHYVSRSLGIGLRMSIWCWWWCAAMCHMHNASSTSMGLSANMAWATHGHRAYSPLAHGGVGPHSTQRPRLQGGVGSRGHLPHGGPGARGPRGPQRPQETASSNIHTSFRGRGVSWTDHPARPLIFFRIFSCRLTALTSVKLQGFGHLGVT